MIGWAYLVASLLALGRDKAVRKAYIDARFNRSVRSLVEPFFIICGLGETGRLVAKALDLRSRRFVVVEVDEPGSRKWT